MNLNAVATATEAEAETLDLVIAQQGLAIEVELVARRLELSFFCPGGGGCLPQLGGGEGPRPVAIQFLAGPSDAGAEVSALTARGLSEVVPARISSFAAASKGSASDLPKPPGDGPDGAAAFHFSAAPEPAAGSPPPCPDAGEGAAVRITYLGRR